MALPRGITALVDTSSLLRSTLAKARAAAIALTFFGQQDQKSNEKPEPAELQELQCELFGLYEELFLTPVGVRAADVASENEVKSRMIERFRSTKAFDEFNAAAGQIDHFYKQRAATLFSAARSLGGMKVVTGGQRRFGPSALEAARITGLYCDTQLLPDPIYPFFVGALHLNAMHLRLALSLFHILPLRPLVDARLPEPPIFVFPSVEEPLEENEVWSLSDVSLLERT